MSRVQVSSKSAWSIFTESFKVCFQWHIDYLLGEMCSCDQRMILICWWVCYTATNMKHTPKYLFNQSHCSDHLWNKQPYWALIACPFYNRIVFYWYFFYAPYPFFITIPNVSCVDVVRTVFCGRWGNPGLKFIYVSLYLFILISKNNTNDGWSGLFSRSALKKSDLIFA